MFQHYLALFDFSLLYLWYWPLMKTSYFFLQVVLIRSSMHLWADPKLSEVRHRIWAGCSSPLHVQTSSSHGEVTSDFAEMSLIITLKIVLSNCGVFSNLDNLSACPRAAKYIKNDLLKFLPKGAIRNKEKMEELESQPVFCCGFQTSSSFSSEQRSERGDTTLHSEQEQLSDSDVQHKCREPGDMSS